ncbi:hypothetical protein STEG23_030027 [Scotinomys teguina]
MENPFSDCLGEVIGSTEIAKTSPVWRTDHHSQERCIIMYQPLCSWTQLSEIPIASSVLLLWRDTMTKAAYKRKHLTGALLIVSEGKQNTREKEQLPEEGLEDASVLGLCCGSPNSPFMCTAVNLGEPQSEQAVNAAVQGIFQQLRFLPSTNGNFPILWMCVPGPEVSPDLFLSRSQLGDSGPPYLLTLPDGSTSSCSHRRVVQAPDDDDDSTSAMCSGYTFASFTETFRLKKMPSDPKVLLPGLWDIRYHKGRKWRWKEFCVQRVSIIYMFCVSDMIKMEDYMIYNDSCGSVYIFMYKIKKPRPRELEELAKIPQLSSARLEVKSDTWDRCPHCRGSASLSLNPEIPEWLGTGFCSFLASRQQL